MSEYTDDFFYKQLEDTNLLVTKTKQAYIKRLNEVQDQFFNKRPKLLWIIKNPEKFKIALTSFGQRSKGRVYENLSAGSLAQYAVPFISLLIANRDIQEKNPELLHTWKNLKEEIQAPDQEHVMENKPSERQKDALFTYDELVKVRDELPDGSDAKLLFSLYTMIEPIRSNFDKVKIYKSTPENETGNYIDVEGKQLVLNKYKTSKIYDTIRIDLPNKLMKQILLSLEKYPREYLFVQKNGEPYTSNSWNTSANRLLKKILGNPAFSISMFRHIYISRKDLDIPNMTIKEKKKISNKMGHSVGQQMKYFWKNEGK